MYLQEKFVHKYNGPEIPPDFIIGGDYIHRWFIAKNITEHMSEAYRPKRKETYLNKWFNIYLHKVGRSDDDRALHDHPWFNISIILCGTYDEVTPKGTFRRRPGNIVFRRATAAHCLKVVHGPVWSLFLTGPKTRDWGFHCPKGWVHWQIFTGFNETGDSSQVGRGCE